MVWFLCVCMHVYIYASMNVEGVCVHACVYIYASMNVEGVCVCVRTYDVYMYVMVIKNVPQGSDGNARRQYLFECCENCVGSSTGFVFWVWIGHLNHLCRLKLQHFVPQLKKKKSC